MGVAECMYEANEVFLRGSSSSTTKPREVNLNCQASQQTPFSTGPSCCPGKSLFLKQKNFFHFLFMIEDAEAVVNSSWFLESTGFFFFPFVLSNFSFFTMNLYWKRSESSNSIYVCLAYLGRADRACGSWHVVQPRSHLGGRICCPCCWDAVVVHPQLSAPSGSSWATVNSNQWTCPILVILAVLTSALQGQSYFRDPQELTDSSV